MKVKKTKKRAYFTAVLVITACFFLLSACASADVPDSVVETIPIEDQPEITEETENAESAEEAVAAEISESAEETAAAEPAETEVAAESTESAENTEPADTTQAQAQSDWAADLAAAKTSSQMIIVSASGSSAVVTMHEKDGSGIWKQVLETNASIGANGVGKTKEGDRKTPRGTYRFLFAFGTAPDPGTSLGYTQVDSSYYWVDDSASVYYNKFVTVNTVTQDWNSAEQITSGGSSYKYVLATSYNEACTPGAGSAIFMHCLPTGGAGCIAVPESSMVYILTHVRSDCVLIIDNADQISGY